MFAVGKHGMQDRAGAARGHHARRLGILNCFGVHQIQGHCHDFPFKSGLARANIALKGIHMCEFRKCLREKRVMVLVTAVHGPGDLAGLPQRVLLTCHDVELSQDLRPLPAVLGKARIDRETRCVGVVVHARILPLKPTAAPDQDGAESVNRAATGPGKTRLASCQFAACQILPLICMKFQEVRPILHKVGLPRLVS